MVALLDFLLVIPTYNEQKYISEVVTRANDILNKHFSNYKILIVDGTSSDKTVEKVRRAMRSNPKLAIITDGETSERGTRVMRGFSAYEAKHYCYIDADLTPSLGYLEKIFDDSMNKYDAIVGSRYVQIDMTIRPPLRMLVSRTYNIIINTAFSDGVKDHQCGFKLFDRRAVKALKKYSSEKHWAWDTEAILIMRREGLSIYEVPIYWVERRNKRTGFKRLWSDIVIFAPAIVRMYPKYRQSSG